MSLPRTACQPQRVEQFLADALPIPEVEILEAHLSVCEQCQSMFELGLERFKDAVSSTELLRDGALAELETLTASSSRWQSTSGQGNRSTTEGESVGAADRSTNRDAILAIAKRILPPSQNPCMLGKLGEFDIVEPLGAGGMGIVFKGYDRELNRNVAIKLLSPTISVVGAARQRFVREAQAAASIVSPYVVPIHAVASQDGLPYFVMSLVPGLNLQEHLVESGPMSPLQTIRIGYQIAMGLAAAHERGIIHRDVKPANILLERNLQRALLTDFGLAQIADDASLTHSGFLAGTPNFMSPEQTRGGEMDARSDLFSLGSVLYTMLAGHPPFRGDTPYVIVKRIAEEAPRPLCSIQPATPAWLQRLVLRLMSKSPEDRIESAAKVAELLSQCEKHLENPHKFPLPDELQVDRWQSRMTWIGTAAAAFVVVAIATLSGPLASRFKTAVPQTGRLIQATQSDLSQEQAKQQDLTPAEGTLQDESVSAVPSDANRTLHPIDDWPNRIELEQLDEAIRRLEVDLP